MSNETEPVLPATSPVPKPPWWKRKWGIVTIVVVALLVIGSLSNATNPDKTASTVSPSPEGTVTSPTASPTPDPTATVGEESAEPTAEPTEEPTAEPTVEPTPAPIAASAIVKTSGRGDKIVKMPAQDEPTYARITGKGSGNFAVISYAGSAYDDLLVNEIGSYSGSVYIAAGVTRLKISANGSWTVEVRPITSAKHWDGSAALTGKGDSVVILSGGASGITTIKNKSKSNFAVIAYSTDGDYLDLLVNEIGAYNGEILLPDDDPIVLSIHAVGGTWSWSAVEQ